MTPRAASLSREDRRQAILDVVIPLIVERGGEVSTREIAAAAGIAEGTIFRVFPDKRSLVLAAAEEAVNPADGQERFELALAGVTTVREQVVVVAGQVLERMHLVMAVMVAVRPHLLAEHEQDHGRRGARGDAGEGKAPPVGPPPFVVRAQEDLHRRLVTLFEAHRDELRVEPAVAAVALRSLIFGASRPELGLAPALTPDQIADLVLHGVMTRGDHSC